MNGIRVERACNAYKRAMSAEGIVSPKCFKFRLKIALEYTRSTGLDCAFG